MACEREESAFTPVDPAKRVNPCGISACGAGNPSMHVTEPSRTHSQCFTLQIYMPIHTYTLTMVQVLHTLHTSAPDSAPARNNGHNVIRGHDLMLHQASDTHPLLGVGTRMQLVSVVQQVVQVAAVDLKEADIHLHSTHPCHRYQPLQSVLLNTSVVTACPSANRHAFRPHALLSRISKISLAASRKRP